MWRAVSNPSRTGRGTMIASIAGANGCSRLTTSKPSLEMVATLRYRLISLMLVSFLEGRVPCFRWAWTRRRSGQSF